MTDMNKHCGACTVNGTNLGLKCKCICHAPPVKEDSP